GKGVALLLVALPLLEQLQCSEYLLRDALHFLYQTTYHKRTLKIKKLMLGFPEIRKETLPIVPILCPLLEVFSLHVENWSGERAGSALRSLTNLRKLIITLESGCNMKTLGFHFFGHQLTYLQLTIHLLSVDDICLLSNFCTNLKTFVLKMRSYGFDITSLEKLDKEIFPSVETLELIGNISINLFKLLCLRMKNLVHFYSGRASLQNLHAAVEAVLTEGAWDKLEVLALPMAQTLPTAVAKELVTTLPQLRSLALLLPFREEHQVHQFLAKHYPNTELVDHEELKRPSHWPT
ncbi:unnamed protein product, partial [Meganyctiphanes norvegica]